MNGYRWTIPNPYARRQPTLARLIQNALPFLYAEESVPGPPRLRFKPRRVRAVPPILDERPLDITRTVTAIYSMAYRVPRIYVSEPEQFGES